MKLVASPDGAEGSVRIHADARLYSSLLNGADAVTLPMDPARKGYVQVLRGAVSVNSTPLNTGDAALLSEESACVLDAAKDAEVLVFDLAA